ncbi:TPA: UDP-N-acetylmuramoyl-L-alanine--D-glutamate ligase [Candidatus Peribacteria bacterium]|nr:MAG: UDP-N-acetylmuramoylalanine--D-glutamate ligase [Candidatus Peribacteria bacterium RIFOXYC2_FULL_58_10]OGJ84565.1 MAG: UDP-N-acetylmuramoylalanine--D-glutamate ligase [Candidatus Peribacteria bacterium RIFOXYD2_FULL_58_15]HAI98336.1 UDP-N-acetylmuramoyl-L-alanine--D-glutamate ligase [Candidatus Peribacteria bacterium]HAS33757.1 UDP-N-acetylmuramoyl-L-alanine--D-glutamate ligase [Candidatus Peribacteria bacterium]
MHIRELAGKTVCILGFGREGRATLEALEKLTPGCEVTIADQDEEVSPPAAKHWLQLGTGWLKNLEKFDVIIKSPGIPPSVLRAIHQSTVITPTQLFFDSIADSGAIVIGVTGSKGKSTTASLIHHILQSAGQRSYLIGNIGSPALSYMSEATKGTIFVMEMSSYQLMDLTSSPSIAVVTSFFPEHLDYHGSLEAYLEAKKSIARFQRKEDTVFFGADSPGAVEIARESRGRRIPFTAADAPVALSETQLIGTHNLSNIAAAFLVSQELNVPKEKSVAAIRSFVPLPHRLQSLGIFGSIEWVDDAISTTPQSAIAGLDALGDRVKAMILGGQDRGYDFAPLAERLLGSKVQTVILLGQSSKRIVQALNDAGVKIRSFEAKTMEEAVALALKHIHFPSTSPNPNPSPSPIVLLSPASPSYDLFKNFEQRGDMFKNAVRKLTEKNN